MNYKMAIFLIIMIFCFSPTLSHANCLLPEDGKKIELTIKECKKISPAEDESIRTKAGTTNLDKLYTGALITDSNGGAWVYPSKDSDPCKNFVIGSTVEKASYHTCCDTGSWGKCVFGGSFLAEVGGEKINAFQ